MGRRLLPDWLGHHYIRSYYLRVYLVFRKMIISSKRKFYDLWNAGVLGNRPQTWSSAHEAAQSGHRLFGIREVGVPGGLFTLVHSPEELLQETARWDTLGKRYSIDGGVRNEVVQLQGEVCRSTRGLEGYFAIRSRTHIRGALAAGLFHPYCGVAAHVLLGHFMDPSSRDDLDALLDLYPDHAVEFACFPMNVGVIPRRNTIFWETRAY